MTLPPVAAPAPPVAPRSYEQRYEPSSYGGEETVPPALPSSPYLHAGIGTRFGARFIDGLVTLAILVPFVAILVMLVGGFGP